MRLRRVRLTGDRSHSTAVWDASTDQWVPLVPALALEEASTLADGAGMRAAATDVVAFLRGGERTREQATELLERVRERADELSATAAPEAPGLPFWPRSFRAFSIYDQHMIASARMLVRHFFPPAAGRTLDVVERVTRRSFPALKPKRGFYEHPAFYMGNHTAFYADGETVPWPRYARALDFELELGFVLAEPVRNAGEREGRAAIGGFFVLDDLSARDVQADEFRHGVFGPVVRSKSFANAMGATVVTADEVGDEAERLAGRVLVNGEHWCEGDAGGASHSLGDMVAWASSGEQLMPGDVLSTGTFPGCCGLELGRFLSVGDTVELHIDGLGTLTNRIGDSDAPAAVHDREFATAPSAQPVEG